MNLKIINVRQIYQHYNEGHVYAKSLKVAHETQVFCGTQFENQA